MQNRAHNHGHLERDLAQSRLQVSPEQIEDAVEKM
jgi:hypothetical protein